MSPLKPVEKERKDDGIRHVSNLTAPERETVINACDADDTIQVWTAQRKVLTKLRKNPAATLVDWGKYGTTVWASFTLPSNCLSFRAGGHESVRSVEEAALRDSLEDYVGRPDSGGSTSGLEAYRKARAADLSSDTAQDARLSGNPRPIDPDVPLDASDGAEGP